MPVEFTDRFVRQYHRMPKAIQHKVEKALVRLDSDFRYPGLRAHPVESAPGIFEAYVDIKYRMTFERRGNLLIMRNVDDHDECLKKP